MRMFTNVIPAASWKNFEAIIDYGLISGLIVEMWEDPIIGWNCVRNNLHFVSVWL